MEIVVQKVIHLEFIFKIYNSQNVKQELTKMEVFMFDDTRRECEYLPLWY